LQLELLRAQIQDLESLLGASRDSEREGEEFCCDCCDCCYSLLCYVKREKMGIKGERERVKGGEGGRGK
jgi:hypothetical protein